MHFKLEVTLIYARDEASYLYLKEIRDSEKIKLYPDFTNIFEGKIPPYWDEKLEVAIVPNVRMKDKRQDGARYEFFLKRIIEYLLKNGKQPFFLIHGGSEDRMLAERINSMLSKNIPIVDEEDLYYIKGIISKSKGVIGSRYHSLVSALSSNVIAIGTGWSHKYYYLFKDYDFEIGLIDMSMDFEHVKKVLNILIEQNKDIIENLKRKNEILREKTYAMFALVKKEIGIL